MRAPVDSSGLTRCQLYFLNSSQWAWYPKVMVPRMTLGLPVPALISGILAVVVSLKLRMLETTMDGVRGLMSEGDIGICRSEKGRSIWR